MAADVGQASACAGLQSRWRDSYERCGRRAKAPPQAEACPTWTGGPTLAQKCEVIPAPALSTAQRRKGTEFACASWSGFQPATTAFGPACLVARQLPPLSRVLF